MSCLLGQEEGRRLWVGGLVGRSLACSPWFVCLFSSSFSGASGREGRYHPPHLPTVIARSLAGSLAVCSIPLYVEKSFFLGCKRKFEWHWPARQAGYLSIPLPTQTGIPPYNGNESRLASDFEASAILSHCSALEQS